MIKNTFLIFVILQMMTCNLLIADEKINPGAFKDFALPSEFEGIKKESGAIYYSATSKGKVLMPVSIWGEVNKAGLHFVPVDTDVVQGLSLAGGPKSTAILSNIKLTKRADGKNEEFVLNLEKGGTPELAQLKLSPGDTVFVEREYYYENRAYVTSLIAVGATILSSILLYRQIKRGQ